ncbi:hypothetical protein PR202_ga08942 [Eleusine coracana subsp. coracana]|uniref:Late embryogenesis abundant protein LEA-2 subgroup domain-containing protein n=1 Tax=Eleusine coracana subsp. coracana TaxID=191504 RepID=A0AAV5C1W1_ELECO|nr:hypothetical protein PR202_ga08942 [Eleusine coracana subsp. coracana]
MASHEHKIDHLDQPYYGPPIPLPTDPAPTGIARRDAYSLFCLAFRVFTLVLIVLGIVALVLWLVYQPTRLKAYVDSASVTRFDLVDNGTRLQFNLTVAVSIRNPNRKQAVLYRQLEAVALYGGEQFGYVDLPQMRQEHKSTTEIRPSFQGQAPGAGVVAALFGREKEVGFFNINVKLHTRVRLKFIIVNSVEYKPDVDCYIRFPTRPMRQRWHNGLRRRSAMSMTFRDQKFKLGL